MLRPLLVGVLLTSFAAAPDFAQTPIPTAPAVDARAYILVDYRTQKTLAAKDAVARMEPASLTKLMTAYIVFGQLAAGKLKLDDQVTVSEKAWRSEGSRTFIEVGKPVPVQILILGMIVQSGNDATIALAERVAGTEETFVQMMNAEAKRLAMVGTHFDNSSGLPSPDHYTTAHDMALLAIALVRDYPQYYKWFSMPEFEYNGIKQQNRNGLLGHDASVDGLKTGHTDSAGFCLVTSALRDGMRLVSVVLGSSSMKRERGVVQLRFHVLRDQVGGEGRHVARIGAGLEGAEDSVRVRHHGRPLPHSAARRSRQHQDHHCGATAAHRSLGQGEHCWGIERRRRQREAQPAAASLARRRRRRLVAPPHRHHSAVVRLRIRRQCLCRSAI